MSNNEDMENAIRLFRAKKIPVYEPGEDDYERYVATANLVYRFSTPPCVVQPKCACDVRDILHIAKPRGIPITIKNGGHSYAGGSTTNVGILMELGLMNEVNLDKKSRIVTVKGGALWFHVYKKLVTERLDGFVVAGGRCPTVGVSGFMLGGGLSPFTRSFGMGCDTVKEFTIVTAEGNEVTVSSRDLPTTKEGRLFWALRGAGGGNFGVVVEMKLELKELSSENVVAGRYTWFPGRDENAMGGFMDTMNSFYTVKWSNKMTLDSSWLCDLSSKESDIAVRFLVYYNGGRKYFDEEIDKWNLPEGNENAQAPHKELKKQLKRRSLQEKSSRFLHETLAAQWVEETKKSMPTNRSYQIYTSFVFKNNRKKIAGITSVIEKEMVAFRKEFAGETGLLQVTFIHSGGAASDGMERKSTAFRWRDSIYHAYIMIQWSEKWLEKDMRGFLERMKPKLSVYGMVRGATFVNFPDDSLLKDAHEKSYYGGNFKELRRVKEIWGRDNYFNWPQGIHLPDAGATGQNGVADHENDDKALEELVKSKKLVKSEEALTDASAKEQWDVNPTDLLGEGPLPTLVK